MTYDQAFAYCKARVAQIEREATDPSSLAYKVIEADAFYRLSLQDGMGRVLFIKAVEAYRESQEPRP